MLEAERRHTKECIQKRADHKRKNGKPDPLPPLSPKELKKCDCPLRVVGVDIRGNWHRESLDTRDLLVASERVRKLELGEPMVAPLPDMAIEEAWEKYTAIIQAQRDVKHNSIQNSYKPVKNSLMRFIASKGFSRMNQIDETACDELVGTWGDLQANTRHHYIQIVQDFFKVAASRFWTARNPSTQLVRPKRSRAKSTLPFDLETEDKKLVETIPVWFGNRQKDGFSGWAKNKVTAAALMYTLRFTGLRISDAILFEPRSLVKRIVEGREVYCYFLARQEKTEEPVFVPIRPDVAKYILAAPRLTEKYAFYDPEGTESDKRKSEQHRKEWGSRFHQNALRYLEKASGVPHVHAHRFRDTFAVDLLCHGVDIRAVSRLLGHTDIGTTLRYYEHWVPGDQLAAVKAMMKTWDAGDNVIEFGKAKKQA
ncbi:MAG: tyrosine-type recombinase/integrase [Candidatus Solibacter sp.]|jgi:site-specific recombinase XerD